MKNPFNKKNAKRVAIRTTNSTLGTAHLLLQSAADGVKHIEAAIITKLEPGYNKELIRRSRDYKTKKRQLQAELILIDIDHAAKVTFMETKNVALSAASKTRHFANMSILHARAAIKGKSINNDEQPCATS